MTVSARKSLLGHFMTELAAGDANWLADADVSAGGAGTAPDPHQMLDAALAACTAITVRMYAERKGMALEDVQVSIDHVEAGGVYRIDRKVTLVGELADADRARLLEIADKCPIHKALSGRFEISTRTV
ncbi:OsmC family protein [Chitinimonas naiadis]